MIDHDDPDVLCLVCGLRTYSGCVCPKKAPTDEEIELGRLARMTRAELATANRSRLTERQVAR